MQIKIAGPRVTDIGVAGPPAALGSRVSVLVACDLLPSYQQRPEQMKKGK